MSIFDGDATLPASSALFASNKFVRGPEKINSDADTPFG